MLDTMTATKVVGGLGGALLVFLLGGWAAQALFYTGGGHGAEEQAYLIEGEDDSSSAPEDAAPVDMVALVAQADPAQGEKTFKQCAACHKIDEPVNGAGPHLDGVAGRPIHAIADFKYSGSLPEGTWTIENLSAWLTNPKAFAPGTTMSFKGIAKDGDRAAVIAYLISKSPEFKMPEPAAAAASAADAPTDTPQEAAADTANVDAEAATAAAAAGAAVVTEGASAGETAAIETNEAAAPAAPAAEAAAPAAAPAGDSAIAAAFAAADVEAGGKVFKKCAACHVADKMENKTGPELMKILNRPIGSVEGFAYSGALPQGTWTLENLDQWLTNPKAFAPGTKMAFAGLKKIEDRANVIAYIESVSN
ncbi:MAG: c-type cytochrome [Mangrovicoccus sp.]|nr:c-type cytochrome [Mangrovicoccus sp.]